MPRTRQIFGPNLRRVLEIAPAPMASELFAAMRGLDGAIVDMSGVQAVADSATLIDYLGQFAPDVLGQLEGLSRQIVDLSDGKGVTSLETVVNRRMLNTEIDCFERQPDELCKSIWTFVNHPGVFEDARSFHTARRYREHGKLYAAFEVADEAPRKVSADMMDLDALAERIGETLDLKAGTSATAIDLPPTHAHPASVMVAVRHGGALSSVQDHRNDGLRKTLYYRPANEAILIYTPSLRKLEVCANVYIVREKTSRAFAETVLGQDLSKKPLANWDYSLERFKKSFFLPLPDYDDVNVLSAKVTQLEMRMGSWKRKLSLQVTADDDIEDFAQRYMADAVAAARTYGYSRVSIVVTYKQREQEQEETLALWVTSNNTSNAQNAMDPDLRDLGTRLLAHWGVMEEQRLLGSDETPKYFEDLLFLYDYPRDEIDGGVLMAAGIDITRLQSAQLIFTKSRQQIVLIEDDGAVIEADLNTGEQSGEVLVAGSFGENLGVSDTARHTDYKIERGYLAEIVLDALRSELGAPTATTETDCIASFGLVQIGETPTPVYLVRTLSSHPKPEMLDLEFRRRHVAGPGLVLATGETEISYLGSNVVVPLARAFSLTDREIVLDPDALELAWRSGQSLVMASDKAKIIRHKTRFATLHIPGQPPLNLFGEQQAILFKRLIAAERAGKRDVRTGELMNGMSSTSPSQLFSIALWRTIVNQYLTQARPKSWRLGPSEQDMIS